MAGLLPLTQSEALALRSGDWEYELAGSNARIIKYHGPNGHVTIPSTIEGHTVTEFGRLRPGGGFDWSYEVFHRDNSVISGVTLPSCLTTIGNGAFASTKITSVTIPGSVSTIDGYAFMGCSLLSGVTIESGGLTALGFNMFLDCAALTSIIIPGSVKTIGYGAFESCSALADVTLQEGLEAIEQNAFWNCTSLAGIIIPDSVTKIAKGAFWNCTSLSGVSISQYVTSFEDPFPGCTSLDNITVDPQNPIITSVDGVLYSKDMRTLMRYPPAKSGTQFTVPVSVTSIADQAFDNASLLTDIALHDGITQIGWFRNCSSLASLTIPNAVTGLSYPMFMGCTSLQSMVIHANVQSFFGYMNPLFSNMNPGFTIFGYLDSPAHRHANANNILFEPLDNGITLTAPVLVNQASFPISGAASGGTVRVYVDNLPAATIPVNNSYYTADITLTNEGSHVIRVETDSGSTTSSASETVLYDGSIVFQAQNITVAYNESRFINVTVGPSAAGMTVTAAADILSKNYLEIVPATVDSAGNAAVQVKLIAPPYMVVNRPPMVVTLKLRDTLIQINVTVSLDTSSTTSAALVPSSGIANATINLAAETISLPDGFTVAAYSVNGGKSWKKGALPSEQAKISKLFDKELTLWLAPALDAKNKPVGEIVKFPKINARPKANQEKLKPWYGAETWALATKTGGAAAQTYEWAPTADKKNPSGAWQPPPGGGFAVQSGTAKTTYLFRTPAKSDGNTHTPASKIFKLTPANFGKKPNYTLKNGNIKLKANDYYQLGNTTPEKTATAKNLSVTGQTGTITIWKAETGKKPRTEKQEITLG